MSESLRHEILSPGPDDGDWGDILKRASRAHRRRVCVITAVTALIAIGVASAYTLGHPVIDFGSAEKAPQHVVLDFGALDMYYTELMRPETLTDQARKIPGLTLNGEPYALYVAPTKRGGFCFTAGAPMLVGCLTERADRKGHVDFETVGSERPWIPGTVVDDRVDEVVVSYADGTSEKIPFVWVTEPIDAGFFVVGVSDEHKAHSARPTAITFYDAEGKVVGGDRLDTPRDASDLRPK